MRGNLRQPGWRSSRMLQLPTAAAPAAPFREPAQSRGRSRAHRDDHPVRGLSKVAPMVAIALLALVAARFAEIIPGAQTFRPSLLATVLGAAIMLRWMDRSSVRLVVRNPLFIAFVAYFAWAQFTAPFALWPGYAVKAAMPTFLPGLVMVMALTLCPPNTQSLDRMIRGLVAAFGVQFGFIMLNGVVARGRLYSGGSMDPNDLASCAAIMFPMAAAMVMRGSLRARILGACMVALCLYMILQTASRGGTLALGAGVLTLVFLMPPRKRLLTAIAILVAVPVIWSAAPPVFRARIQSLTSMEEDYNTTDYGGRKAIWKRGRGYVVQYPVTGVGLGNFPLAEGASLTSSGMVGKWSAAHNAYIQAYAEFGVPGGSLFVALLLLSARAFWQLARKLNALERRPELLAGLSAFAVGAIFLSHAYFWLFFGLVGLAALSAQISRFEERATASSGAHHRSGRQSTARPRLA